MTKVVIIALSAVLFSACAGSAGSERDDAAGTAELEGLSAARKVVVGESYRWLGVPYRYGGNDRRGVDCSGLVTRIFLNVGVKLPRTARQLYRKGRGVTREEMLPGDLVFFRNTAGKGITHVGVYVGNNHFVHASSSQGVISSGLFESYYREHYAGARKIIR